MKIQYNRLLIILSSILFLYGCEYERIADPVNQCDPQSIELIVESVQNTACAQSSGEIVVSVIGDDQYEYQINSGGFSDNNIFTGLSAGSYSVQARATDSNCLSEEIDVSISNEDGLQISLVEKNNANCGENTGTIIVEQQGGIEPIEYIINENAAQESPEFTGLSNGDYTIVARDANGCEDEISGVEIMTGISFSNNIKSIITTNCAVSGCHNGSQPPNFSTDENIIQNASRIKSRTGNETMPPAGRPDLTEDEIQAIACWVDDGALDN
ncbi:hypothetical protein ABWH96_07055 [Marivirga tractuosa]|uniref:hypothetical protein n=1 Tax=Marivirga tractuosa TaxID=1006 RepID=UPI0035CED00E